jgi:hypothetical protein
MIGGNMASTASRRSTSSGKGRKRSASRRSAGEREGRANGRNSRGNTLAAAASDRFGNVTEGATRLTRSMKASGRRLERSVSETLEENSLMVGAALFVCGAAVGYVVRELMRDSAWLEEQREAVMHKAKDLARTASDKVGSLTQKQNRSGDPPEAH